MVKKGKAKRAATLEDKINARREKYGKQKLKRAILSFFASCDEDDSGYLEAHEFVVAQTVIAEIAGDDFDAEAARHMSEEVKKLTGTGGHVSPKEFEKTMMDLCEVIPRNADEIINELAEKAAVIVAQVRRELAMELRKFFKAIDADHSGYLDEGEIELIVTKAKECAAKDSDNHAAKAFQEVDFQEILSMDALDKSKDGKVEISEFVDKFIELGKKMKVPKRDIIAKLREFMQTPSPS
mmetsp:Transcript_1120/g.3098  ORF Transcript_1120/g.3098 Transcript_1120/m.3098 type:complete len:239 (-) Transcript_1120:225-941(-)